MRLQTRLRRWEPRIRPVHPDTARVLQERWAALPMAVRTPAQTVGRHAVGCAGTHGVFPKCNLTCTPCYYSADTSKVRVDGDHTVREVDAQMAFLRERRGPYAHAQLIGGEVSLLHPDAHAAALLRMRAHGREPMSMTHGDFDRPSGRPHRQLAEPPRSPGGPRRAAGARAVVTAINYAAGLTAVRRRDYLIGTALGIVPGTVAYASLGAYGTSPGSWPFGVAVVALVVLTAGGVAVAHRHRRRRGPATDRTRQP